MLKRLHDSCKVRKSKDISNPEYSHFHIWSYSIWPTIMEYPIMAFEKQLIKSNMLFKVWPFIKVNQYKMALNHSFFIHWLRAEKVDFGNASCPILRIYIVQNHSGFLLTQFCQILKKPRKWRTACSTKSLYLHCCFSKVSKNSVSRGPPVPMVMLFAY